MPVERSNLLRRAWQQILTQACLRTINLSNFRNLANQVIEGRGRLANQNAALACLMTSDFCFTRKQWRSSPALLPVWSRPRYGSWTEHQIWSSEIRHKCCMKWIYCVWSNLQSHQREVTRYEASWLVRWVVGESTSRRCQIKTRNTSITQGKRYLRSRWHDLLHTTPRIEWSKAHSNGC